MAEFEKKNTYYYEPKKEVNNSFEDIDKSSPYYGTILGGEVLNEINVWTKVLMCLKDGLPKPYDNSIIIDKIIKIERKTGENLEILKNCCPPSAEVREAKEFKPLIFGIIDRIIEIGEIKKYVDLYK